jgi:Sap, sulfolipid-1-addressing protein
MHGGPEQPREASKEPTVDSKDGNVRTMWSTVLILAVLVALNPLRLGLTLLLISRSRPVQNLFAYWIGNLTSGIPMMVVPLTLLHVTPAFESFAKDVAKSSTVRHIQIGSGVFALAVAALMTVHFLARSREQARQRAQVSTGVATHGRHRMGGPTSTLVLDSDAPTAVSRLLDRARNAQTEGGSAFQRLLGRAHNAWENGSLWVAFVIGLANFPAPDVVLMLLAIIVASGAAVATQVSAAVVFIIGILAVAEITLVSYLVTPAKTQAALRLVHDWAWAHRRKILIAVAVTGGISLLANGLGAI